MTVFYLGLVGVGLLLGLLGGGGSLLLVPLLIYLGGFPVKSAIALSLSVVGPTSLIAAVRHTRQGNVCWKNGLAFGLSGMAGAYGGGRLAGFVPENLLMILFALMMLVTALSMLLGQRLRGGIETPPGAPCPARLHLSAVLFDGLLVGVVTGLVGVGGGFVIVPALNLLGGLAMRAAIGTSLLVIGMNSLAALIGYSGHAPLDGQTVALLSAITIPASLLGHHLSRLLPSHWLRHGFGVSALLLAGFLLQREVSWASIEEVKHLVSLHQEFFRGILTAVALILLYWIRGLIHQKELRQDRPG